MTKKPISDFHLGPAWAESQAIGAVVSGWALVELHIDAMIWTLAEVHPLKGACITAQLASISRRLYAFAALIAQYNPSEEITTKINKYIETSNTLARKRNRVAHDPWLHKGEADSPLAESYRLEITAEKKLKFQEIPIKTQELYGLAIEIENHRVALMDLAIQIDAELGTSLKDLGASILARHSEKDGSHHGG